LRFQFTKPGITPGIETLSPKPTSKLLQAFQEIFLFPAERARSVEIYVPSRATLVTITIHVERTTAGLRSEASVQTLLCSRQVNAC
jgi:hypothetical protein